MPIAVNSSNFQKEVLDKSLTTPVLVDFWAPWCGPCRTIGPVLEKLEKDFSGDFILVKINTDEEQDLSAKFGISGIPAVKLFVNAKVKDEFTGALPEPQIRGFLEKNIPNEDLTYVLSLFKDGKVEEAAKLVKDKQLKGAEVEEIIWVEIVILLGAAKIEEAKTFLALIPDFGSVQSNAKNFLLKILSTNEDIADNKNIKYFLQLLKGEDVQDALEYFYSRFTKAVAGTENSSSNGDSNRDKAKEDLLACFALLGEEEALVNVYRKKMAAILFS